MIRARQLLLLILVAVAGCEVGQVPPKAAPAASSPPPPPPPAPAPAADDSKEQAPIDGAPATAKRKLDIQLSTGVALAQTGTDGTLMSFSVDYTFTTPPAPGARYGLVIQRRDGQAVWQEEKLQLAGNLTALMPGWRPEDGPFYGFIVEWNSNDEPVAQSESIELTGP